MPKENYDVYWKDYYEILQLHTSAEPEVIKAAYLKLVQKYNTDQDSSKSDQKWKDLNEAYEILGNTEKKPRYDLEYSRRLPKSEHVRVSAPTPRPKPVVLPPLIRVSDVTPGEPRKATFVVTNEGAAFSKIRISKPNDWIQIPRLKSLSAKSKLPLRIELELTGDEWGKSYSDNIIVKLDDEETHVRIEFNTIPEPAGARQAAVHPKARKSEEAPKPKKALSSLNPPGPVITTLTPTLQWKRVPGAEHYNIWLEKWANEAWNVIFGPRYAYGDSIVLPEGILAPGGRYFWFAVAQGEAVKAPGTSKVQYFQT